MDKSCIHYPLKIEIELIEIHYQVLATKVHSTVGLNKSLKTIENKLIAASLELTAPYPAVHQLLALFYPTLQELPLLSS